MYIHTRRTDPLLNSLPWWLVTICSTASTGAALCSACICKQIYYFAIATKTIYCKVNIFHP